ncbi:M20/M25/M40 family metallo-hydrolase [Aeromicrobium sp. YIM 150415]|uniref:M20/M25/M40 family metallo-hydrolase n=1 Tax=Aeromicrobium sp. YIM 150415 TaxID=2803912 RepID=UPI001965E074|nr:M20/M25/M40 family metallo-hydrolase [Aeromicrobium sp. YIM 150415]MBM9462073.1 M20/M25/M40 family metallo-hydrolase [Aeromicrobium sp. YIM 150415]
MTSPAERLARLIACRTVSAPDEREEAAFEEFRAVLAELYPLIHERLERTELEGGGLLFRWPGAADERPVVLMAHYDVVPAPAEQWSGDPFAGIIDGGRVIGRGALDDKGPLVTIAEAVETLLSEGFTPEQDVYLSFGADEEVFGTGAARAVDHLERADVRPWLVSDEGGAVVEDAFPGVQGRLAMIGIVEKGTVDVELLARGGGGHASTPAPRGATARLARAIVRLERHPMPPRLTEPVRLMLRTMSQRMRGPQAGLFARVDRFARPLAELLARAGPETAAMVRTTTAVTRLSGSPARNVLATEARATVNVRLLVGDTKAALVERLEKLFRGLDIEIAGVDGEDPPPVSRTDNDAWRTMVEALAATMPDVLAVPYAQTGGTDSRHFTRICDSVYRFAPLTMSREQRDSIHAPNEFVEIEALDHGIAFFRALLTGLR